jgi:hypothetical protein
MPIRTRVTSLAFALLVAGCGGGQMISGGGGGPFAAAEDGPQTISIHVQNLNFNDATLWAISPGGRQRLGIVGGKNDAVYRISWNTPQTLQLEIDVLAGSRCTTEPLQVDPGDSLDLQIQIDLAMQQRCR